jgi:hypothetical protein
MHDGIVFRPAVPSESASSHRDCGAALEEIELIKKIKEKFSVSHLDSI